MDDIVLSFAELLELLVALGRNRMPDRTWNEFSDNYKRLQVLAGALADTHFTIRVGNKSFSPFDAELEELTVWGSLRNVTRREATAASAANAGVVRGTTGGSFTTSDLLVNPVTGIQYAPTAGGSVGAGATVAMGVIAQSTGSDGLLQVDDVLQWVSTPAGLEDEVRIQVDFDGDTTGFDLEGEDSFRNRVIAAWQQVNKGGAPADFVAWILESNSEIATGYVWKWRNGRGTVDVAGLKAGDGSARLLTAPERTALQTALDALTPAPEQVRVLEVMAETAAKVQLAIVPEPDFEFSRDWDDSAGLTVSAYTPATRVLQLSATRPVSIQIGSRIVIDGTTGEPFEVESLGPGADELVLVTDRGETITPAEEVYAGGGLTQSVWQAVKDFINALGPRRGDRAAATGTTWVSTADLGRLFEVVQTTTGVLDHTQELPAADIEPTELSFPDDTGVNVLVPGNIIVRYA